MWFCFSHIIIIIVASLLPLSSLLLCCFISKTSTQMTQYYSFALCSYFVFTLYPTTCLLPPPVSLDLDHVSLLIHRSVHHHSSPALVLCNFLFSSPFFSYAIFALQCMQKHHLSQNPALTKEVCIKHILLSSYNYFCNTI